MGTWRAAKIWKRTVVGVVLALGAAALVWSSSIEHGERIVLGVGVVFAVWGLLEVHRMPVLGERWMALAALPSVALVAYGLGHVSYQFQGRLIGPLGILEDNRHRLSTRGRK